MSTSEAHGHACRDCTLTIVGSNRPAVERDEMKTWTCNEAMRFKDSGGKRREENAQIDIIATLACSASRSVVLYIGHWTLY